MVKDVEYLDEDYEEIVGSENETDLITKMKTPLNLALLGLILLTIVGIVLSLIFL